MVRKPIFCHTNNSPSGDLFPHNYSSVWGWVVDHDGEGLGELTFGMICVYVLYNCGITSWWLSTRLQELQCISNWVTAVLYQAIMHCVRLSFTRSLTFTNTTMHLFHIPQCTIQNRNVHISILNSALWDMEQMHCGICEVDLILLNSFVSLFGQNCLILTKT